MSEANETRQKAQAVINAIAKANATAKEQAYD
jgi:anthranilate synthase component 1